MCVCVCIRVCMCVSVCGVLGASGCVLCVSFVHAAKMINNIAGDHVRECGSTLHMEERREREIECAVEKPSTVDSSAQCTLQRNY